MGVGRSMLTLGAVVAAIVLFPAQTGVAQQLPSGPSLPPTPNLPAPNLPTPNLPTTPNPPVPDVSVPDVQAPKLPVSPPSTPNLPSTGVGTDALPTPGSPSGQSSNPSSPGGQASVQGQTAGGGNGSPGDRNRASAGRRGAGVAPPRTARQQRLERVVRRRSACLPALPSAQRRVVVMRSGFGPGGPRARPEVARMLDTGVRRVARLERQAIDALGTDGPGGACSTAPGFAAIASGGLLGLLGLGEGLGDAGSDSDSSGGSAENAQARVAGESVTGGSESSDGPILKLPLGLPAASATDLGLLFVIVLMLFFAAGVGRELLSSRRRTAQSR